LWRKIDIVIDNLEPNPQQLIVFARYPEPGKVKTRLISAVGAVGAANLQRQMTEHTLLQARQLREIEPVTIDIHVAGGERQSQSIEWLGTDLTYHQQPDGDLGTRMAHAFARAFAAGSERVVLIGTDCPGLTPPLLQMAFDRLHTHDLTIGPALDGGYYLIGLRRAIPGLFVGIEWGSDRVFSQTMAIAEHHNLTVAQLVPLADIDRPEDLPVWQAAISSSNDR
jgi:uncharacterized protein